MNELKTRNTFSVATQSFTRLGDHQAYIYRVYQKNGVHLLCQIISKLLKLIAQFWTCFKPRFFSFEQAAIRIFTPSNVCAMTNLVKAIDLRRLPIMQIHYVFHGRQLNF